MRILVIGAGTIGREIIRECEALDTVEKCYVYDNHPDVTKAFCGSLEKTEVIENIKPRSPDIDLVVESASQSAVREFGKMALDNDSDLMIMSIGALVDDELRDELFGTAKERGLNIYLPSGALSGLDGVTSSAVTKVQEVTLETRKPPSALKDSKFVRDNAMDLESIKEEKILYSGPATEVVKLFPKNVNVAATLSLSGIGFERTTVKVICDPNAKINSHTIRLKGDSGELLCSSFNAPSPDNPGTSYLASLSAVSTLRKICSGVWIGV